MYAELTHLLQKNLRARGSSSRFGAEELVLGARVGGEDVLVESSLLNAVVTCFSIQDLVSSKPSF